MTWSINANDLKTFCGLVTESISGWRDSPARSRTVARVPGIPGEISLDADAQEGPRRLVANGLIRGTSAADVRTKLDLLAALLATPVLKVITNDMPTRQVFAELESFTVQPGASFVITKDFAVAITLVARDPFAYDVAAINLGMSAGGGAVALGTGPVRPFIRMTGGAGANPVLTYRDSAGNVVQTMTLTVGFGGGDIVEIDCSKKTITLNGVSRLDLLTAGDFFLFDIAKHGVFATSAWPTFACSIAATLAATLLSYNKSWR